MIDNKKVDKIKRVYNALFYSGIFLIFFALWSSGWIILRLFITSSLMFFLAYALKESLEDSIREARVEEILRAKRKFKEGKE